MRRHLGEREREREKKDCVVVDVCGRLRSEK